MSMNSYWHKFLNKNKMNREDKSFAQNSKQFIMLSPKWEIITPYLCMGAVHSDFLVRVQKKKEDLVCIGETQQALPQPLGLVPILGPLNYMNSKYP